MVLLQNGQEIAEGASVWLNLENIKNLYVRGRADWPGTSPPRESYGPENDPPEPSLNFVFDIMGYPFDMPWYETGETIFFVHGWNMPYENSISFARNNLQATLPSWILWPFCNVQMADSSWINDL